MNYKYSARSLAHLDSAHPDLQLVFKTVLEKRDNTVVCGHRGKEAQNAAFNAKRSQLKFPESKHNQLPSMAVDVYPYPLDFAKIHSLEESLKEGKAVLRRDLDEFRRMDQFIGYVLAVADRLLDEGKITHRVFSGSDWDGDSILSDQQFHDLPHFELRKV